MDNVDFHNNGINKSNSILCILLCSIILMVFGFLPKIPSAITQLFRPLIIMACFVVPGSQIYRIPKSVAFLIIFQLYYILVLLMHPITHQTFMAWASVFLFGLFFVMLSLRTWSRYEIQILLNVLVISCTIFSLILLKDNPKLYKADSGGGSGVQFFGAHVNVNAAGFDIAPGAVASIAMLMFSPQKKSNRFKKMRIAFYGLCALVCVFTLTGLAGRSAFFSTLAGGIIIVLTWIQQEKDPRKRNSMRTRFLLVVVIALAIAPKITEGTSAERLFDYSNLTSGNGRDELADIAWSLIREKPFFGGGFSYWDQANEDLTCHNTFLHFGVQGGITGMILIALFFVFSFFELLKAKDYVPLAFFIPALMHSFTETIMDYYAYLPLLFAFILLEAERSYQQGAHQLLR